MASIFQNTAPTPVTWNAQAAAIMLNDGKVDFFSAATGITIDFQRSQSIQYPIGGGTKNTPIKLLGAPTGTIQLTTLIGPKLDIQNFIKAFTDQCKPFKLTIKSQGRAGVTCAVKGAVQTLTCSGCTGSRVVYQIQAQQQGLSIATGQFVISFTGLQWTES